MFSIIFAWTGQTSNGDGNPLVMMMPLFAILLIFYFLMIRPQVRRQKEQRAMLDSLKKGDNVIAAGGIYGTIAGLKDKDNIVILKISDNVKIEVLKTSVSTVIRKE